MANKDYKDWNWVDTQVQKVIRELGNVDFIPELITGMPRGGLIPAVILSHRLDVDYIPLTTAKMLPKRLRQKTLVIDDIVDTGETALRLAEEKFTIVSLCYRSSSKYRPFVYGERLKKDDWIVFPWEAEDSETIQDYLV